MELRSIILQMIPQSEEKFNYGIPAYALIPGGKRENQIMFAGYKSHIGFYPHPTTMSKFEEELKPYKRGKGSVQFPVNTPLPSDLIKRMILFRMKHIQAQNKA